jgi:UDP-glucose 4-epimerase
MRVFVTGGAGYIGSHTCVELIKAGIDLVTADNLINSNEEAIERVKRITGQDFGFFKADIRDEQALESIFASYDFDAVIHFAGLKAVGESVSKPMEYYNNNLNSTLTLLRVMRRHNVNRIVFSSSATVYSGKNTMPLLETSAIGDCTNPYAWTKFMSEQILRDIALTSDNWSILLLRYFNPIGAHESGLIGEDPRGIPNNLTPYIAQVAIGRHEILPVYGNDFDTADGTGVRDYLHVTDLAKGHVKAVEYAVNHKGVEAINLGTGQGISVLQMIESFERVNSVKVPYKIETRRPGDLAVTYADANKALKLLGWRTAKSLDDMVADIWRWQKQNPDGYVSH